MLIYILENQTAAFIENTQSDFQNIIILVKKTKKINIIMKL